VGIFEVVSSAHDSSEVLDNPAWTSLTGAHARFAERVGDAARYPADVSPFAAVRDTTAPQAWEDAAALIGPGATMTLTAPTIELPPGWRLVREIPGVQMVADGGLTAVPNVDVDIIRLSAADAPEMRDLVARTEPGPFLERTYLMGNYLGIRKAGRLVAMTGERLHPTGYTEISAVCTDAAERGHGYAATLVCAVADGIRARGQTPFLHTGRANAPAIRLYERLGFRLRSEPRFVRVEAPMATDRPPDAAHRRGQDSNPTPTGA
jgi:ribosomal protein S18 acetylase RimI-like enzyme